MTVLKQGIFILHVTFVLLLMLSSFSAAEEYNVTVPKNSFTDEQVITFGKNLYQNKEYYRAITEFKRFIFLFPKHGEVDDARVLIAKSYFLGKNYEECAKYIGKHNIEVKQYGKKVDMLLILGDCYIKMKRYILAKEVFQTLIDTSKNAKTYNLAYLRLARLFVIEGKWQEASDAYANVKDDKELTLMAKKASAEIVKGVDIDKKNPVTAGILAAVLPGAGHLYVGRKQDAIVSFVLNSAFIWGIVEAFKGEKYVVGGVLCFFEFGWYGGNINGAVNGAYKYNDGERKNFQDSFFKNFDFSIINNGVRDRGAMLSWNMKF